MRQPKLLAVDDALAVHSAAITKFGKTDGSISASNECEFAVALITA